jgi:hypothetical protein
LVDDLARKPSFAAFRCDRPSLVGTVARRTSYVRTAHLHRDLLGGFTTRTLFDRLAPIKRLEDRQEVGKAVVEQAFEFVRRQIDVRLPSRLDCTYACSTLEYAVTWQRALSPAIAYQCTVQGWWFQGDANKVGEARATLDAQLPNLSSVEQALGRIRQVAVSYWQSDFGKPCLPELLVDGIVTLGEPLRNR